MAGGSCLILEIKELKQASSCKIIKDVGSFAYVVTSRVTNTDVSVKFQLTASYPSDRAVVHVKGLAKSANDCVQHKIEELVSRPCRLIQVYEYIAELAGKTSASSGNALTRNPNIARKSKKKAQPNTVPQDKPSKKPPMRTANDVVKRFQWDSALDKECVVVGYLDRFLGIQEQPFQAFNWVNPAAADWMDLNIPEHRIEYFKYGNIVVWEKCSRTDNVFGSTGGATIEAIVRHVCDNSSDCLSDFDVQTTPTVGPSVPVSAAGDGRCGGSAVKEDSSDDESDVCIVADVSSANPLAVRGSSQSDSCRANVMKQLELRKASMQQNRPNHFIALPVTDAAILEHVQRIQDDCSKHTSANLSSHIVEPGNLHVTLSAIRIDESDLDIVTECMYDTVVSHSSAITREPLTIGQLSNFWSRVLYASVCSDSLDDFVMLLRERLREAGVRTFDKDTFVPHLTLIKLPQQTKASFPMHEMASRWNMKADREVLGRQTAEELVLFSMERDECRHYNRVLTLQL